MVPQELEAALTEQKAKPVEQATPPPAPVRHVACQVYVPDPAASQAESDLAAARLETEVCGPSVFDFMGARLVCSTFPSRATHEQRLAREAATASKARKQAERALEQERKLHAETRQQLEAAAAELEAAKAAAKAAPKRRASRGANSGAGARAAKLEEELKLAHARALALQKEVERATAEVGREGEARGVGCGPRVLTPPLLCIVVQAKEWSERAGVEAAESGRLKALLAEALGRLKRAGSQRKGPGNPFVEHVAVTKENAMLRQQVEMMKLERKKYLAKLKSGRMG